MNRRFDKLEKDLKNEIKNATDQTNTRLDSMSQETNARFDSIEKDLKLINSLPTIAKELSELE